MKTYLVDDEPLARQRLRLLLESCLPELSIVGETGSSTDAIKQINELKPDVVFLDIQMPGLDGFDVVSMLENPIPYIIFVTAYDEYAIKAFEIHALDYLTKPVRLERLEKAVRNLDLRVQEKQQITSIKRAVRQHDKHSLHVLPVKKGRKIRVLEMNKIQSFEADKMLNFVHTADKKYVVDYTLDELEERLDPSVFVRIHRSSIISLKHVDALVPWVSGTYELKLKNGRQLHVARRRVANLKEKLGI